MLVSETPSDGQSFPSDIEEFKQDPRISWSRLSQTWTLEAEDGAEYEYDDGIKRWVPTLDKSLAEQQQMIYAVDGVDETLPAVSQAKKRKVYTSNEKNEEGLSKKPKVADQKTKDPPKNRAVYVTNLPPDTNEVEIQEVFSKCGVIAEEIDGGKPRIKLYRNDDDTFKGDALVVYFRPESVALAVQMLDDTNLRFGSSVQGCMRVQAADFSYKVQKERPNNTNTKEKRKIIKKMQKLNNKLADWDDDGPNNSSSVVTKFDKTVILKHMFSIQELEEDPSAILDLKEDIREECEKLGDVTNVVLYDKEEEGVVSVKFKHEAGALACVRVMNGRFFGGQKVEAYISDGTERFRKSSSKTVAISGEDEQERLEKFGSWLETPAN
ncbi:hypothetical protein EDC01DRAFT_625692 [Geopyxis carbonaria]|nr:hypothetical protein EDC01DRAFT_625692 [Geopyxis carbonaria]